MMTRSDLDGYRANLCDTAHLAHAAVARLRSSRPQNPDDEASSAELGDAVAGLVEAASCVLGELERARIAEDQAQHAQHDARVEVDRLRQAWTLSRSRYAELVDVALATLAAIAHGEHEPGAHLEHTLEAHGHSPRMARTRECRHVLADPATWRHALEVA